jgi:hypothetical protein
MSTPTTYTVLTLFELEVLFPVPFDLKADGLTLSADNTMAWRSSRILDRHHHQKRSNQVEEKFTRSLMLATSGL